MEEKKEIVIAGFKFTKKKLILIVVGIAALIGILALSSYSKDKREKEEADRMAALLADQYVAPETQEIDYDAMLQEAYSKKYGQAPEGFKWAANGDLVAIGSSEYSAEDIIYIYLRSLSMLDFATASKYASYSAVEKTYENYYGVSSTAVTNYRTDFERQQYKTVLTSLEILGIGDTAIFNNGDTIATVSIEVLDLTDKDFWKEDKDMLFQEMRKYNEMDSDKTKQQQFLYNYILDKITSDEFGKRQVDVELVVSKKNGGGWLISDDKELDSTLGYDWGTDVVDYIQSEFDQWLIDQQIAEQVEQSKQAIEDAQGESTSSDTEQGAEEQGEPVEDVEIGGADDNDDIVVEEKLDE